MDFRLDRSIPIPLAEQIKGQVTYAISYGRLSAGQALPSVRELSTTLGVAPMTIAQVYRDLAQQGLVISRPGVGTFVADMAGSDANAIRHASQDTLQQLADGYVRQAVLLGYSPAAIRSAFQLSLDQQRPNGHARQRVLMVGNFEPATTAYARTLEELWRDLAVEVTPVMISQLTGDAAAWQDIVGHASLAVTIPTRLQDVRAILEPRYCRVVAVAFAVSAETRQQLSAIAPDQQVGIISTYPEFLQTIIDNVAAYALLKTPPRCAMLGQDRRIDEILAQIDVLIYASGSEAVCERLPQRVQAIEYRHSPEPDSVNRLRPVLA
jgi:DNA-binding transcriptional regulator YhcF (GntR family)